MVEVVNRLLEALHLLKVRIVGHTPSHVSPDVLLWVQFRAVSGQPLDPNWVVVSAQETFNRFGFVALSCPTTRRPVAADAALMHNAVRSLPAGVAVRCCYGGNAQDSVCPLTTFTTPQSQHLAT
jgi:hypothetical protein